VAEIKRMYVVPAARRQGLGRRLLEALEDRARELGYARIRLDTGARQPHAQAMYERAGYHPIDNYNGNSMASFWGEKILR
jgi:GNAT superfamily N-acetyltransferase